MRLYRSLPIGFYTDAKTQVHTFYTGHSTETREFPSFKKVAFLKLNFLYIYLH